MSDQHRTKRQRRLRLAWWFGALPAILCAMSGVGLLLLPGLHELPQRDRVYGWLLDLLSRLGGYGLLALAAFFALIAGIVIARALRSDAGPASG